MKNITAIQFKGEPEILKEMIEDYSNAKSGDRYILQIIDVSDREVNFKIVKEV